MSIRVLIVDDSAFMRKSLSVILEEAKDIEIVGIAKNGKEAVELTKSLNPDVVTLDIEMPIMDGLTALQIIMKESPTSVIMVSSLTTEGAEATLKALELGAVDFIPKENSFVSVNIRDIKEDLFNKIRSVANRTNIRRTLSRITSQTKPDITQSQIKSQSEHGSIVNLVKSKFEAVGLGISTGGPLSLQKVIPQLSPKLNIPIFIVQHMPPKFTNSLAQRLNSMSQVKVKEAENGEIVQGGTVYIAPGGFHMTFQKEGIGKVKIKISTEPSNTLHRPAVDNMLDSCVDVYGNKLLGVIMTGMGKDGYLGIEKLKKIGGFSIAQDEESCVVYGMPRAIVDGSLADIVAPLEKIPDLINKVIR